MSPHVDNLRRSPFLQLNDLQTAKKLLTKDAYLLLVHLSAHACIMVIHCYMLYAIIYKHIHHIQCIQNTAAKLIEGVGMLLPNYLNYIGYILIKALSINVHCSPGKM